MERGLEKWEKLIAICKYFLNKKIQETYLRSCEIENVDTKFIENDKKVISLLLDEVLPNESINRSVNLSDSNGFERRYKLRYDRIGIRIRLLDDRLKAIFYGFSDIQITVEELEKLRSHAGISSSLRTKSTV